jgi:hypothetical protein
VGRPGWGLQRLTYPVGGIIAQPPSPSLRPEERKQDAAYGREAEHASRQKSLTNDPPAINHSSTVPTVCCSRPALPKSGKTQQPPGAESTARSRLDRRLFPAAKHAERVGKRPPHCRGDLAGDAHRQRANVLMLDRKCERPFLAKHRELLACFLDAAISLDPIWRCHARSLINPSGPVATTAARPGLTKVF